MFVLVIVVGVDLLLVYGKVLIVDKCFLIVLIVVVKDGKIVVVGGDEVVKWYCGVCIVDFKGCVLMFGFNDIYVYIQLMVYWQIDMIGVYLIIDLQVWIKVKVVEFGFGEWIIGVIWDEVQFVEKWVLFWQDLDVVVLDNFVVLVCVGGYSIVGNSVVLCIVGIDCMMFDFDSGLIEYDVVGELNGVICEWIDFYSNYVLFEIWVVLWLIYIVLMKCLLMFGIMSFYLVSMIIDDELVGKGGIVVSGLGLIYCWLCVIYDEMGSDLLCVIIYIEYFGFEWLVVFFMCSGDGDMWVWFGGIGELLVDGGFIGLVVWLLVDYKGLLGYCGKLCMSDVELQVMVDDSVCNGWQMVLYVIGDVVIVYVVDVYSYVLWIIQGLGWQGKDWCWFFDYFMIMLFDVMMVMMVQDGIMIVQQLNFFYNLEGCYEKYFDDECLVYNNLVVMFLKYGIFVVFFSDNLLIGLMVGFYVVIICKGLSGCVYGVEEVVFCEFVICMYIVNIVYLLWEEGIKGLLEMGKLVDMIVFDCDVFMVFVEQILQIEVDMIFVGGKFVYQCF